MKPWGLCVVYLYIALFIVSILTPVSSSYKRTICFIPNAYMHMPWPLWERQMHIGQTCQTTSSWADGQPSKHKHFQRLWRSCVSVKRLCIQTHAQLHISTASITHYQTGAGSYFCPLNDPTTNVSPQTVFPTHSNTETRMKCVGEMKKRWQDIKRVEHKTGTGGRLSSLTIQILSRTASHALTYAWWPHHALAVLQTPRAWSKHMNLNSLRPEDGDESVLFSSILQLFSQNQNEWCHVFVFGNVPPGLASLTSTWTAKWRLSQSPAAPMTTTTAASCPTLASLVHLIFYMHGCVDSMTVGQLWRFFFHYIFKKRHEWDQLDQKMLAAALFQFWHFIRKVMKC